MLEALGHLCLFGRRPDVSLGHYVIMLRHNWKFCLAAVAKEFQFQKQPIPFSQMWQIFGGRERSYAFPFPIDFVDSCGMYCSFFFWFGFVVFSAKLHCTLGDIALYPANAAEERSVIK